MVHPFWCEHLDKSSKYVVVNYRFSDKNAALRVQTWYCPECGVHGAETELVECYGEPAPEKASGQTA